MGLLNNALSDGALIGIAALLFIAALLDIKSYRIPNWIPIGLVVIFLLASALNPEKIDWSGHLAAGLLSFAVGALMFLFRPLIGAGDVKLLAAVSFWLGFDFLSVYLLFVSLFGAVLFATLWVIREITAMLLESHYLEKYSAAQLPRVLVRHEDVPFGVAIAAGAVPLFGKVWALFPY